MKLHQRTPLASPEPENFIEEVIAALKKRSKSIKHSGGALQIERVKEIENGVESSVGRLDITVQMRRKVQVRLIVWGDRWIWVDARQIAKLGWLWESTLQGRLLGDHLAKLLVAKIQETISAVQSYDQSVPGQIERIWKTHLAAGPAR
jgi:hypothetical protein